MYIIFDISLISVIHCLIDLISLILDFHNNGPIKKCKYIKYILVQICEITK